MIKSFRIHLSAFAAAAVFSLPLAGGCSRPLPEAGSTGAETYTAYCGSGCHSPYQPGLQTAAMWELTLARMETTRMRAAGILLGEADRREIREYLIRNAGGH